MSILTSVPPCEEGKILCNSTTNSTNRCLDLTSVCDGINDCGDWEDEFDCSKLTTFLLPRLSIPQSKNIT